MSEIEFQTESNKKSLIGVLLIILAIGVYVFFAKALAEGNSQNLADIASRNTELGEVKTQVEELKQAEEEFELATEVQRLESLKAIPRGVDQDEIIRDLNEISDTYDIELNSISFGKGNTQVEEIGTVRISASFEGNYLDLTDFLEGLEENARLFKVDSISVQINSLDLISIQRANFSLNIEAFYQQPNGT